MLWILGKLLKSVPSELGKWASDLTQHSHSYVLVVRLQIDRIEILMAKHFCVILKLKENEADTTMQKGLCFNWKQDRACRLGKCKSNTSCTTTTYYSVSSMEYRKNYCLYLKPLEILHDVISETLEIKMKDFIASRDPNTFMNLSRPEVRLVKEL